MRAMPIHESTLYPWQPDIFALVIYCFVVCALIGILLFLAGFLGEKKPHHEKQRPYECGIIPTGSANILYPVPFYLIAIFFLVFDVEALFIFSWAAAFDVLGWIGWMQIAFFIIVLLFSLLYLWKKGGLVWGSKT
jgi:NADH-quinone oxidoreductase subunit A